MPLYDAEIDGASKPNDAPKQFAPTTTDRELRNRLITARCTGLVLAVASLFLAVSVIARAESVSDVVFGLLASIAWIIGGIWMARRGFSGPLGPSRRQPK